MYKFLNPLWIINNWLTTYWIGAAISVAGSIYGASQAKKAAGEQVDSAQQGIDEINKIGDRTRADTAPYRALGSGSVSKLSKLLGVDLQGSGSGQNGLYTTGDLVKIDDNGNFIMNSDLANSSPEYRTAFNNYVKQHQNQYGKAMTLDNGSVEGTAENDLSSLFDLNSINSRIEQENALARQSPEYGSLLRKFNQSDLDSDLVYQNGLQFGLDQGNKAIENRARALGGLDSGAATKAAIRYANDYGTTKTEGAYNRNTQEKSNIYNMLMGGTGVGQSAVNTDAKTGENIATALAGQYASQGNARAAGESAMGKAGGAIAETIGGLF